MHGPVLRDLPHRSIDHCPDRNLPTLNGRVVDVPHMPGRRRAVQAFQRVDFGHQPGAAIRRRPDALERHALVPERSPAVVVHAAVLGAALEDERRAVRLVVAQHHAHVADAVRHGRVRGRHELARVGL